MYPASGTTQLAPARPRIVVVTDVYATYERRVVSHLNALAAAAGQDLIVLCGGALAASFERGEDAPSPPGAEAFHALVGHVEAVGAIVLSGALGLDTGADRIERFVRRVERLSGVPVVSLAMPAPGIASVGSDDPVSLRALVEHATRDPARTRFAFLRGHRSSHDSMERERIFRAVLAERGLAVDEGWVMDARFRPSEAYRLVSRLLESGARPHGLVAASDVMAAAAVRAFNRHGLRVPEDVVVAGFDDDEAASMSSPPLTTVRLPVEDQLDIAFALLQRRLSGWRVPAAGHHIAVPGRLIRRGSTGPSTDECPRDAPGAPPPDAPDGSDDLEAVLRAAFASPSAPDRVDAAAMSRDIARSLTSGAGDPLPELRRALAFDPDGCVDVHGWRHVQGALDAAVRGPLGAGFAAGAAATLSRIHGAIDEAVRNLEQQRLLDERTRRDAIEALHLALGSCTDRDCVVEALAIGLAALGVRTACLCLYTDLPGPGPGARAELAFVRIDGRRLPAPAERFAAAELPPPPLAHALGGRPLVVAPVQAATLHHGFLLHDISPPRGVSLDGVAQSVAGALQSCRYIESLERTAREVGTANASLARLAGRDPLTGLHNRAGVVEALERCVREAGADGSALTVLYFDLDGFKAINDTYGHAAGDRLLRAVAVRVRRALRRTDVVARLGGDEFTAILPGIGDRDGSTAVARSLLGALARPVPLGATSVSLTASIGIARFPTDGEDGQALLRHADAAMYRAKAEGRNRYAWFCRSIERHEAERLALDRALRRALDAGELSLAWQPRVSLDDGRTLGFEALLRWASETSVGRSVGPAEFVPLAERTGHVRELDAFAFDLACRQQASWDASGHRVRVSVNLSAASLRDDDLVARTGRTMERHGVDPATIELELGEGAAMDDIEHTVRQMRDLRALGLHLSIDDFGTACSSPTHLGRLPADRLKIDRSFVRGIVAADRGRGADAAVARAIVALGRELGFATVVEGIETPAQREFFAALGCDEAQGYLFGRPLDGAAATALLDRPDEARRAA